MIHRSYCMALSMLVGIVGQKTPRADSARYSGSILYAIVCIAFRTNIIEADMEPTVNCSENSCGNQVFLVESNLFQFHSQTTGSIFMSLLLGLLHNLL